MSDKTNILTYISQQTTAVSMQQISGAVPFNVTDRTVRRWLNEAANAGDIIIQGHKRSTTYLCTAKGKGNTPFRFLKGKSPALQEQTLKLLRDFWTHHSTAIEGNTLTLGDTQFILDEGLTVSGKPIKEHQEVIGHASAIELVYRMLQTGITKANLFELHKAIQTDVINDIYKPYGAWKVEPNGTRIINENGKPTYLEYAHPLHVDTLMAEVISFINNRNDFSSAQSAINTYTKVHAAIAHIHPFWDGNGRIARLAANIPMLKAGLPPIVIPNERRREYIRLLANYELQAGQLNNDSGAWPQVELLEAFEQFCSECYDATLRSIEM